MTKVKICGITNYEDAADAVKLGADFIGFNFYNFSPRCIKEAKAKKIVEKLPKSAKKVGIFVNERISRIKRTVDFCKLDLIQLSGDEDEEFLLNLKRRLDKHIIKSFRIKSRNDIKGINKYKIDYIMLDSFKKGFYGGTGKRFDWGIAKYIDKKRLFLSGGLDSSNVKTAIHKIKPYAVDACSGIEESPGKKNFEKMKKFIEAAKCRKF